jgi:serine/threonine-protein kinase
MGEIYKARDPRLNRTVAVKVLPASATGDPERRRRFLQEAQAASGLNHPNIITIHDIVTDDGSDYMVMEFIAGKTLTEVIPPGGLDMSKTLQYATQIADALGAAHAAGIVHRDLKPGNVMVTPSARLKILDFGLAKVTTETALTEATQTIASGPVTVEGSILGTVSYMSPEQAQGKRVDQRSDIFAFGALLYEMVTGRKAFAGDSALTTLTAILRDEVRPVSDFASGVPPELEEVIGRALRKDPAQRWQNMQEIYGVLAALRQRYESGILDPTQILPPRKKKSPLLPAAAVVAITILGLSGWWVAARRDAAPKPQAPPPQQQAQAQPPAAAPAPVVEPPPPAAQPKADDKPATAAMTTPTLAAAPKKDDGTVTNDSVIAMLSAKVAEPVIVSQIKAAPKRKFELSTQEVIRLTRAGASPAVLEAMRNPVQSVPVAEAPPSRTLVPAPAAVTEAAPPKLVVPPPTETKVFTLSNGLPVAIQLAADVPADPDPGTPLKFTLKGAFNVNGTTVLAAGAPVIGEVAGVKKGLLGRGAKPTYRLISVASVDGSKIALRAVPAKSDKMERVLEASGKHDKSLTAPAGTEYVGYIDGAQTVTIRK